MELRREGGRGEVGWAGRRMRGEVEDVVIKLVVGYRCENAQ